MVPGILPTPTAGNDTPHHDASQGEEPIEAPAGEYLLACLERALSPLPSASSHEPLAQGSLPEGETDSKKPRRSDRLSKGPPAAADQTPVTNKHHLPSPVTNLATEDSAGPSGESIAGDHATPRKTEEPHELSQMLSSPPQDTQPLSQLVDTQAASVTEEEDEEDEAHEGVWGYLVPLDARYGDRPLVLKKRNACPRPDAKDLAADKETPGARGKPPAARDEEAHDRAKNRHAPSGGYLIGRHPECGEYSGHHLTSATHAAQLSH